MKLRQYVLGVAVAVGFACVACGCGQRAQPTGKARPEQATHTPLPDWAPKDPSPEFLRALKVLKPLPLETLKNAGRSDAENAARVKGRVIMWIAAYEFFGTLSDEQVSRFLQIREMVLPPGVPGRPPQRRRGNQVVIPIEQLTKAQRAALDRYFEASREDHKVEKSKFDDCLVTLYKMGAKRDLSNVRVGFDTAQAGGGHMVNVIFYFTLPDGNTDWMVSGFAQI
jgi:hypothetical protein